MTKKSIIEYFEETDNLSLFDKPFRKAQLIDFIFKKRNFDFLTYTNLPKELREKLSHNFNILKLNLEIEKVSVDGTKKFLFKLLDSNFIESVLLKDINNRYTFCISTQCGCKMGCSICQTAKMGFIRNLDYAEIISQILFLLQKSKKLDNIVFMGMGEPLDNFDNLVKAIKIIISNLKFSQKRITVSTCGITNKIPDLINLFPNIKLAVSINSLIQEKREKIMPISKIYPLNKLFETLDNVYNKTKNRITLEYVLIKNFNTCEEDISAFKKIGRHYHINLIPFNSNNKKLIPDKELVNNFYKRLKELGFNTTIRLRRGADIQADCGQLYYDYKGQNSLK